MPGDAVTAQKRKQKTGNVGPQLALPFLLSSPGIPAHRDGATHTSGRSALRYLKHRLSLFIQPFKILRNISQVHL